MTEALASVAPGRPLREGLDRILQANMGALIVVGDGPEVLAICSGGFLLDAEFTPQRLSELGKMDGAIILASDSSRIARANVHLVPNPHVPTSETGTRHRTAERVARSIPVPVISVSEDMSMIAVYVGDLKHPLEPIQRLLNRANQALQTLERYKNRLDTVSGSLSALEVEDLVTVRDVATVLQRAEMVRRIAEEIEGYVIELGADGRLVMLQLEELIGGVEEDRRLVAKDYFHSSVDFELANVMRLLAQLDDEHITVKGPDGTAVDAIHARPDGMPRAGLVVHPDMMGVRPLFDDLCRRLATHGFAVCAPEPFVRAPVEVRAEADSAARMAHVKELDDDLQIGDLEAAADYLVVHDDIHDVAVLGFCMGGMQVLKAAASGRFDRAVAFYGMIRVPDDWVGAKTRQPLDTAADVCPTLAIFGGQ